MSVEVIAIVALIAGVVLLFVWRTIRFFIRLAIFGLIVLLVLGLLGWAYWADPPFGRQDRPANMRRAR